MISYSARFQMKKDTPSFIGNSAGRRAPSSSCGSFIGALPTMLGRCRTLRFNPLDGPCWDAP
jgi:hypothetical protein